MPISSNLYQRQYELFLITRERKFQKGPKTSLPAGNANTRLSGVNPNDLPAGSGGHKETPKAGLRSEPATYGTQQVVSNCCDILRTVEIPLNTVKTFLELVKLNTNFNVETCGVLAGHSDSSHLHVTHVIIPEQLGSSNRRTATNEEQIFQIQNDLNLITLGWIHTRPSASAFMSSLDLHTQYSYQRTMPEAIAIVCATSPRKTGFYKLTSPYGLNFIAGCREIGSHPHYNVQPLVMEATHIQRNATRQIIAIDLRKNKRQAFPKITKFCNL